MSNINEFPWIPSQTAAATSQVFDARSCDSITVSADNLAGGETVTLKVMAGATAKQVTDIYGVTINLTAVISAVTLEGGAQYQFVKSVTASACAVYVSVKQL